MQRGFLVAAVLVAIAIFGAVRAYAPARAEGSRSAVIEVHDRGSLEPSTGRGRTLGVWLLAMTGTAVVLRARRMRGL
jgi:hypothetical protein